MAKGILLALLVTIVFLPVKAQAVDIGDFNWTTQISFLSDYYTRGISQTRELPTPQILSTVFHSKMGLYAGVFASRVEFFDNDAADAEVDVYAGINKYIDKFNYRIGLIHYLYPNADSSFDYDFTELDLAIGYNFSLFSSTLGVKYSPNYFANSGRETYLTFDTQVPLTKKLNANIHAGRRDIENNAAFYGFPDNYDWSLGVEYNFAPNLKISGRYADSSFKKSECIDLCNGRLIAGISYSF